MVIGIVPPDDWCLDDNRASLSGFNWFQIRPITFVLREHAFIHFQSIPRNSPEDTLTGLSQGIINTLSICFIDEWWAATLVNSGRIPLEFRQFSSWTVPIPHENSIWRRSSDWWRGSFIVPRDFAGIFKQKKAELFVAGTIDDERWIAALCD